MIKKKVTPTNELKVEQIDGYFERIVNKFGNGAKIDCPREYLGKRVYVIVGTNKKKNRATPQKRERT